MVFDVMQAVQNHIWPVHTLDSEVKDLHIPLVLSLKLILNVFILAEIPGK